jgi:hypothetical protein
VKNARHRAHIDGRRCISQRWPDAPQLPRAFFIRAVREPKEEMVARLADIAAIQRSGRFDRQRRRKIIENRWSDRINLAFSARQPRAESAQPRRRQHGRIFHKS